MNDPQPTRCRWFQFRLPGFLLAIALSGAFLGWVARERIYIRERQRLMKSANHVVTLSDMNDADYSPLLKGSAPPTIPRWRMWLGDEAVLLIQFAGDSSESEQEQIKANFPEAKLVVFVPPLPPGGLPTGTVGYLPTPPALPAATPPPAK